MQLLKRFDLSVIYTDSEGCPIPKPEPLLATATVEEKIAWVREVNSYMDKITEIANRSFELKFNKSLKDK